MFPLELVGAGGNLNWAARLETWGSFECLLETESASSGTVASSPAGAVHPSHRAKCQKFNSNFSLPTHPFAKTVSFENCNSNKRTYKLPLEWRGIWRSAHAPKGRQRVSWQPCTALYFIQVKQRVLKYLTSSVVY